MKRWKQFLVTGILAVSMVVSALPVFADEPQSPQSVTSESQVLQNTGSDTSNGSASSDGQGEASQGEQQEAAPQSTDQASTSPSPNALFAPAEAPAATEAPEVTEAPKEYHPTVSYETHVQNIGWQGAQSNGATAGTTGQSLRLEAIKINLNNDGADLGIQYRTHIQNIGWESGWHRSGEISGTTGRSLRLEAVQMQLTGSAASDYDLYFRVHAQNIGWMGWAKASGGNAATAGTSGASLRLEAIQIAIVKAGSAAPSADGQATSASFFPANDISYQTHVQNIGWQNPVGSKAVAGTSGRSLRLEAISINTNSPSLMGFQYRTHIQNIGWENSWHNTGEVSGTTGQSLRLEAIQIKLTGEMSRFFDVYYRTHVQNIGWMGWAKNGESAGSEGYSYRMEAIQVVVCCKGQTPDGSAAAAFMSRKNPLASMDAKAQAYSSRTGYLILIDKNTHYLSLYRGSRGNWSQDRSWKVDVGAPGTSTPSGVFNLGTKLLYFDSGTCRCWYASQVTGSIYLHSVLYFQTGSPSRIMDGRLGMSISHGCIRMELSNAKWIWDNVPAGTTIVVY